MNRSREIGWSIDQILLWEQNKEIRRLQGITYNSGGGGGGISQESSQTAIVADLYSSTFFKTGRTYQYLNVTNNGTATLTFNVGTSPSGTEIASDEVVISGETVSIAIGMTFSSVTPLYIWSTDWTDITIDVITISTPI